MLAPISTLKKIHLPRQQLSTHPLLKTREEAASNQEHKREKSRWVCQKTFQDISRQKWQNKNGRHINAEERRRSRRLQAQRRGTHEGRATRRTREEASTLFISHMFSNEHHRVISPIKYLKITRYSITFRLEHSLKVLIWMVFQLRIVSVLRIVVSDLITP